MSLSVSLGRIPGPPTRTEPRQSGKVRDTVERGTRDERSVLKDIHPRSIRILTLGVEDPAHRGRCLSKT